MFDAEVKSRRNFGRILAGMAGVALVGGGGTAAVASVRKGIEEDRKKLATLPWPYAKLEPDAVAARAFESYTKGKCMFGTFDALAGLTAERLGPAYTAFPFELMSYGTEGIRGWATVCGALNGAAAAFQLLSKDPGPLVDALFGWYEQTPLPSIQHVSAKFPTQQSVAGSTLCHVSIAHWCEKTARKAQDPAREERCSALVASVARRSVELLNTQLAGRPLPVLTAGGAAERCGACHDKGGAVENAVGKQDCEACHFHLKADEHPKT
jgi:hypothetical protein